MGPVLGIADCRTPGLARGDPFSREFSKQCRSLRKPVIAGKGRGIIYVQGEQKRTVAESEMLDALDEEAVAFAARVEHGEAELSASRVSIVPPDLLPRKDFHPAARRTACGPLIPQIRTYSRCMIPRVLFRRRDRHKAGVLW